MDETRWLEAKLKYHVRLLLGENSEMCASFTSFIGAAEYARECLADNIRRLIFESPNHTWLVQSRIEEDGSVHYLPIQEIFDDE